MWGVKDCPSTYAKNLSFVYEMEREGANVDPNRILRNSTDFIL